MPVAGEGDLPILLADKLTAGEGLLFDGMN